MEGDFKRCKGPPSGTGAELPWGGPSTVERGVRRRGPTRGSFLDELRALGEVTVERNVDSAKAVNALHGALLNEPRMAKATAKK